MEELHGMITQRIKKVERKEESMGKLNEWIRNKQQKKGTKKELDNERKTKKKDKELKNKWMKKMKKKKNWLKDGTKKRK